MIEIWFSILTKQQVRRGVCHDVPELIAAIEHLIDVYNQCSTVHLDQNAGSGPRRSHQTTRHFRRAALVACKWVIPYGRETSEPVEVRAQHGRG
jgi:hypothetical protein